MKKTNEKTISQQTVFYVVVDMYVLYISVYMFHTVKCLLFTRLTSFLSIDSIGLYLYSNCDGQFVQWVKAIGKCAAFVIFMKSQRLENRARVLFSLKALRLESRNLIAKPK